MRVSLLICLFVILAAAPPTRADDAELGIQLTKPVTQRWKIGVAVSVEQGSAVGLQAVAPIPDDWPEQQVTILDQEQSSHVRRIRFRTLGDGAKQMLVDIPRLNAGERATALLVLEITKSNIEAPDDSTAFVLPARPPAAVRPYLVPSPLIESTHPRIRKLAEEIVADEEDGWKRAEAIFDWVRENVQYQNGPLKGALAALDDRTGDCEELTSLFVALCRANKIPARSVWVPGHCYPEFYLQDKSGRGHWFPCQAAGADRDFARMPESRFILQKGDSFRVPGSREPVRYAHPTLTAANAIGGAQPKLEFITELVE